MVEPTDTDISPRQRWLAIGVATVPLLVSYIAIAATFATNDQGESMVSGRGVALGLGLTPFVFVLLAFVSGHRNAGTAVLKAMGLFLLAALPVGLVSPALGVTAGYGAGGTVTLRAHEATRMKVRWSAVGATVVYVLLLLLTIPEAGLLTGGVLPLMALGFADEFSVWRASRNTESAPE
jgi:hypothetical protein